MCARRYGKKKKYIYFGTRALYDDRGYCSVAHKTPYLLSVHNITRNNYYIRLLSVFVVLTLAVVIDISVARAIINHTSPWLAGYRLLAQVGTCNSVRTHDITSNKYVHTHTAVSDNLHIIFYTFLSIRHRSPRITPLRVPTVYGGVFFEAKIKWGKKKKNRRFINVSITYTLIVYTYIGTPQLLNCYS